jgi:F-type H+-transporting ATPase subunit b
LLVAWLLVPGDTYAQEAPGKPQEAAAAHAGGEPHAAGHAAAEPNIFEYALDLTIWTIVVFLCLLFILGKYAWKPMLEGLKRREENIRAALDEAQRARADAERVRAEFQAEMNRASEKVRDMLDEARKESLSLKDEMLGQAKAEIQKERERLRREIETARDQALQEIWNQAARLATSISAKAIRRQLTEEDHRRLVEESLAELRQAGSQRAAQVTG